MSEPFHSGFASIIGRPNAGKSTLLNQLAGTKLAIVSEKPQTTRNRILGVVNREQAQIVLIDTPGIHKPRHKLGEYMVKAARQSLKEVDVAVYVVDVMAEFGTGEQFIIDQLKGVKTPVFLVLNKIDCLSRTKLLPLMDFYRQQREFAEIVPISALKGENVSHLADLIVRYLPEGPRYYPEGMITDQPELFVVAELIREKALMLTREEVPHSLAVVVEQLQERGDNLVYINAVIHVERDSQKGILVGKSGGMLKEIGKLARADMERLFGSKVFLELWVKVKKDWRNSEAALRGFGYGVRD